MIAAHYAALSVQARSNQMLEVADLFARLAREEQNHERSLLSWAQEQSEGAPDRVQLKWQLPPTFDDETATILANSQLATPYRVLAMAVRNEERAFSFWTYVAANAGTSGVRQLAENMAHEELNHVALLRQARRRAYHAMRGSVPLPPVRSIAEKLAQAVLLETRLAGRLEDLAGQAANDDADTVCELAAQAREMADEAGRHATPSSNPEIVNNPNLLTMAEFLVENYLDIADLSRSEPVVAAAQSLAQRAIVRLAKMRTSKQTNAASPTGTH